MKLFKKDEKDKLRYKIGHKIFGELYDNKKEKALVFLVIWFVFIFLVTLFVKESLRYQKEDPIFIEPNILIEKLNDGYKYDLTINNIDNETHIYYIGEVNSLGDIGVKKENDNESYYKIVNNIAYDFNGNEINYPYDELSLNIIKYLNNYDNSYLENDLKVYEYNINYNNSNILVILKTTYDKISLIKYDYLNNNYIINIY